MPHSTIDRSWPLAANRPNWGVQLVLPAAPIALRDLAATARRVEALGFDGCFIFDHPLFHASPEVVLTVIATATGRVRIGSIVHCAAYRHPRLLARLMTDLDAVSGSRVVLGLGAGNDLEEFDRLGLPFGPARERIDQVAVTLDAVEAVWRDGAVPAPAVRPPVLIGGSGERRTLRLVAERADACNLREDFTASDPVSLADRVASVGHKLQVLDVHCAAVDRDPATVARTHMTLFLMLARTETDATAKLARYDTASSTHPRTRRGGTTFIFAWTPARAVDYYRALLAVGIDEFIVQLDATDGETLELLAREVVPHVRA